MPFTQLMSFYLVIMMLISFGYILTMLSFIYINCIESLLGFHILLSIVYRNNFVCVLIRTSMILYPTYFIVCICVVNFVLLVCFYHNEVVIKTYIIFLFFVFVLSLSSL
jgi:hypothetical protein